MCCVFVLHCIVRCVQSPTYLVLYHVIWYDAKLCNVRVCLAGQNQLAEIDLFKSKRHANPEPAQM